MTRTARAATSAAIVIASLAVTTAFGRETYIATDGSMLWGEIAGATAPIVHPGLAVKTDLPNMFTVPGIATDGTSAYVAARLDPFTLTQSIYTINLATGLVTSTRAVNLSISESGLQDLAFMNGDLYGVWFSGASSNLIRRINQDATLTTVFNYTGSDAGPQVVMAASDQADRVVLIPTHTGSDANAKHLLIDATTWTTVQTVAVADNKPSGGAALANLDGSRILEAPSGGTFSGVPQTIRAVPGFTVVDTTPPGKTYGRSYGDVPGARPPLAMADAIDLAYPSSLPAVAEVNPIVYTQGDPRTTILLRRAGDSFSLPVNMENFATPDGTTLDQVVATSLLPTPVQGGTPVVISANLDPADDLSTRRLATAIFTIPADATLVRGRHTLSIDANLQARYTTTSGHETRPIQIVDPLSVAFAVDPVSDNYIGNGDFSLGGAGWSTGLPGWIATNSGAHILSQYLELGTPDSPMRLAFDYACTANTVSDLAVRLNGLTIASLAGISNSSSPLHFSIDLADPALRNLINPLLEFDGARVGTKSGTIYLSNISLTAIPEPTFLLGLCAFPLLSRRRH